MRRWLERFDAFQQRHPFLAFPLAVRQKYADDQGGYLAATLAYYGFFSIFPLLLVLVTLLGYALAGNPSLQRSVLSSAVAEFPVIGPQLQQNVHSLTGNKTVLVIGVAAAVWSGMGIALAAENAMDHLWGVSFHRRANALVARLRALLLLVVIGSASVGSVILGAFSATAASYGVVARVAAALLSLVVNVMIFLGAFRVLTTHNPRWRDLWAGAIVGGVAWEVLQTLGGYYVSHVVRHASSVYGLFAIVLGLLSWLYLTAHVTLLSAEVNVVVARRLWPRSFSIVTEQPLTPADAHALRQRADVEERRSDENVNVSFESARPPRADDS